MADNIFTIEGKISESATTTVYRARQEILDRIVLLKVLHKHLITDQAFVARFRREARTCAAIHSENIVQVYDLTEIDGAPAIVMEYVEGSSLKEILEKEGKRDLDFVRNVAKEVLKGLSVAHASDIIHRDIKPGNILAGSSGSIMITDFGLASFHRSATLTYDGMILGTPAYMSPEQVRGEIVDARTDLFSLGVTIIELLTLQRIFEGDSYNDCLKRILSFSVDSIEQFVAGIPPDFLYFLQHLLAPRKVDRFASAKEALRLLIVGKKPLRITRQKMTSWILPVLGIMSFGLITISIVLFYRTTVQKPGESISDSSRTTIQTSPRTDTLNRTSPILPAQKEIPASSHAHITKAYESQPSNSGWTKNDSGSIIINCQPWGMIYIDSVYVGQTPLPHPLKVKAGKITITFSNPLFLPITRIITIVKNGQTTIEENFLNYAGYLTIRVTPWADIYVDDQYRGTTPISKPIITSLGIRKIRLHNPVYEDLSYDAKIQKGDTLNLSFTLSELKQK